MANQRYFLGFELPIRIQKSISRFQANFTERSIFMQPIQPHITVLPPVADNEKSLDQTYKQLLKARSTLASCAGILYCLDHFDQRVLHITVLDQNNSINNLRNRLLSLLKPQYSKAAHVGTSYAPHVTLVQVKPKQQFSDQALDRLMRQSKWVLPIPQKITFDTISIFKRVGARTYIVSHRIQLS